MDKREACHRLADMNEVIYDDEKALSEIDLRLKWDHKNREWLLNNKDMVSARLERHKKERDEFVEAYCDVIYS